MSRRGRQCSGLMSRGVPRSDVGGVPYHVSFLKMHLMLSTHPLPPPREQTDAGENITFPQLAGGNNVRCRFRDSMQISRDENRLEQTDFAFLFILTIWPYRFKEQQSQRGYFGLDWLKSTEYRSLTQQLLSKNCVLAVLLPSPRIWKLLRPSHPRFFLPFELFLSTNCKDMQLLLHLIPGEFFYWTSRMTACSRTVTTHDASKHSAIQVTI